MSEMETHVGTLREIDLGGLTLEEKCKELCDQHNVKMANYYKCYQELLEDMLDDWYIVLNGVLYRIDDKEVDDDYCCQITENNDGSLSYYARFYNGGTCLIECLENEHSKLR